MNHAVHLSVHLETDAPRADIEPAIAQATAAFVRALLGAQLPLGGFIRSVSPAVETPDEEELLADADDAEHSIRV